jgi:hypothetical protein
MASDRDTLPHTYSAQLPRLHDRHADHVKRETDQLWLVLVRHRVFG